MCSYTQKILLENALKEGTDALNLFKEKKIKMEAENESLKLRLEEATKEKQKWQEAYFAAVQ